MTRQSGRRLSEVYRILLDPAQAGDEEIAAQLGYVNVFGSAMYPLVMAVYRDYQRKVIGRDVLLETLERLQSLFLRKMVVGESRDHLAAQLCRRLKKSGYPIREIVRRTPSNERVRNALKYRALPHAGYVLQRLETASLEGLEIEHIFPQSPTDTWSGDGQREWASFTEEERARHRALLQTLGNLALLEQPLAERALDAAFPEKRSAIYLRSSIPATRDLADVATWGTAAIAERTARLTTQFPADLGASRDRRNRRRRPHPYPRRPATPGLASGLAARVRIRRVSRRALEGPRRQAPLQPRLQAALGGLPRERRRLQRAPRRADLSGAGVERPVGRTRPRAVPLHGLDSKYMLTAVQGVLEESGLALEVFVKVLVHRRRDVAAPPRANLASDQRECEPPFGRLAFFVGGVGLEPTIVGL